MFRPGDDAIFSFKKKKKKKKARVKLDQCFQTLSKIKKKKKKSLCPALSPDSLSSSAFPKWFV